MGSKQWTIDGARVRALRIARMMTMAELAAKAGVAERTIADIERGLSGARPETIRCIAKALGVEPAELLEGASAGAGAPAIDAPKRTARTQLDGMADRQRKLKIAPPPVRVGKTMIDVLTPVKMQDVFARHAAFEGTRFVVEGVVDQQRALSVDEARALRSKVGVGARYHVISEAVPGEPLGVTVHAAGAKLADALQAKMGERVRLVVAVRVVGKNDARVVSLFASTRKRAWAFVVERVI